MKLKAFLSKFSPDERTTLYRFVAFQDVISIDWLSNTDVLPSHLLTVISFLERKQWISPVRTVKGMYAWTPAFPRDALVASIPGEEMTRYYRDAVNILTGVLTESEENCLKIAEECILAGLRESDLNILLKAALHEEKNHRTASSIRFYDNLLEFLEKKIYQTGFKPSRETYRIMITAVERRASLSLLHPDIKKVKPWLLMAKQSAVQNEDIGSQVLLELLIGQNCWMRFQYDQAVAHFDEAWEMIRKVKDAGLQRLGQKLRGLSHWIRGNLLEAIKYYEESIGEIDHMEDDDFSLITGLHLSQCYTNVGMTQRALGISEAIYNRALKNENWPLVSFSLANTGLIRLEMGQFKDGRAYFEKSLEISRREFIPMAELMAGIGLSNIECQEGRYDRAAEHFKVLYKLRKSSWYHTLNASHIFEPGFILHKAGLSPVELNPVIRFLNETLKERMNPLLHGVVRRLQIKYLEDGRKTKDQVAELLEIEKSLEQVGALLVLAKVRIDIARLFLEASNWAQAEDYARKAWEFLKHTAKAAFPPDLQHLIRSEDLSNENRLYDLVIEMGEALTNQKSTEQLLTNIITSISRLTGAERAALFIVDDNSSELKIAASRNLTKEHLMAASFKETMDLIRQAAKGGEDNVIQYEKFEESTIEVRKIIITPLLLGKRLKGVLYQDSRFFSFDVTPDRKRLLAALASQIAVSIDRAQAHDEIARLNERLIEEKRYYQEEKEEFRPFGEIIGSAEAVRKLHQLIRKVAPTKSTVLITGETGVGKELVARAIHRESDRREGPFIRVNCAALPDTLIDSELFGHEKGAFTGANQMKPGRFELANGGTIFLDEVSELPLSTQSRLLRILQEKEFQRVGGTKTLYSDFRMIAATNKDLSQEVEKGNFRSDLFFRLNVFPIFVPPLRERKEDIPALAANFLKLFCAQYNRHYQGIPRAEMEKLMMYPWPGNVRELANVIERSVILGGPRIRFAGLDSNPQRTENTARPVNLKEAERNHILHALEISRGKVGGKDGASSLLGLKRTTLIHKMKKHGITIRKNAD
ncbi:MAG TPA: sigma 54-interacting transcriptional regulator [Syntrophales bacterium]|nr:sigma 54-interacting transcriptional regulator [Syntrophales bacterium]